MNLTSEFEQEYNMLAFCSFLTIIHGKKLNLPNIFLLLLKNKKYRELFKLMLDLDCDYQIFKMFIEYDPTLYKSKYISKYLNKNKDALK
jgi:hypothetical protein